LAALSKEASLAQRGISAQGELLVVNDSVTKAFGLMITTGVAGTTTVALDAEQQVSGDEMQIQAGVQEKQGDHQHSADSWGSLYQDPYLNSPHPVDAAMEDPLIASSTMATSAALLPGGGNFY